MCNLYMPYISAALVKATWSQHRVGPMRASKGGAADSGQRKQCKLSLGIISASHTVTILHLYAGKTYPPHLLDSTAAFVTLSNREYKTCLYKLVDNDTS